MSKSGHCSGGSTLIGPRNRSWFSKKTPAWTKMNAADLRTEEKLRKRKAASSTLPALSRARPSSPASGRRRPSWTATSSR
ncbi:hypothetical protein ACVWXM_005395 [Bradyrhizobium sp. GM7.3]